MQQNVYNYSMDHENKKKTTQSIQKKTEKVKVMKGASLNKVN